MTKHFTVDDAREIGERLHKDIVLIMAYDEYSQRTEFATWGRSPTNKSHAVIVRDKCLEAFGLVDVDSETHQDYRFVTEGERAQIVDRLVACCRAADHAIASIMAVREGMTDKALQNVRDAIAKAVSEA